MPKLSEVDNTTSPSRVFVTMALDMSWKLALAVLVPIVGGFKLDQALDWTPVLSILGFVFAMIGMGAVLWQALQSANRMPVPKLTAKQKRDIQKQYEEDDD